MEIKYCKLYPEAYDLYKKATIGSSGFDLRVPKDIVFSPYKIKLVKIGIALEIPIGYEGQIRPRSSMSLGFWEVSFGTIDSDYRGEIKVILKNNFKSPRQIEHGEAIAQLIICKTESITWSEVNQSELSTTDRGVGGFGSTGK